EGYIAWAKEQQDPLYQIKYEQMFVYLQVIEKYCVVSRLGIYEQHQGLDTILEEVNKMLKTLISPVPQNHHWKIAAHNCKKFFKVTNTRTSYQSLGNDELKADMQNNKENMTKVEISLKIETLLEQLSETAWKKYSGFRLKKQDELLSILQEIKCLFNSDNKFNNQDSLKNS
ncbi:7476_t:CDS:2, partial [Diversispora eburnea]